MHTLPLTPAQEKHDQEFDQRMHVERILYHGGKDAKATNR